MACRRITNIFRIGRSRRKNEVVDKWKAEEEIEQEAKEAI